MGQKTHPYGFRLGYNNTWRSRWYADGKDYANLLHEDLQLREELLERLENGVGMLVVHAHLVQLFVAGLERGHYRVPLALDVGAVGVELVLEAGFAQDPFARRDVRGDAEPHAERKERMGRNPKTGEAIKIPASKLTNKTR